MEIPYILNKQTKVKESWGAYFYLYLPEAHSSQVRHVLSLLQFFSV